MKATISFDHNVKRVNRFLFRHSIKSSLARHKKYHICHFPTLSTCPSPPHHLQLTALWSDVPLGHLRTAPSHCLYYRSTLSPNVINPHQGGRDALCDVTAGHCLTSRVVSAEMSGPLLSCLRLLTSGTKEEPTP